MRVYCLDLEIRRNTLFLLHILKDLRGLLFYMLCTVFRRIVLKIYVMILLTFSDSCNLCILFYFEFYVTVFIYPASATKHNKRMWKKRNVGSKFPFPIDFAGHRYNSSDATAQPVICALLWWQ